MAKTKVDIEPKDFLNFELTHDIKSPEKKVMIMGSGITIEQIVGEISPGMRRFGFTAGQFSLSDLIDYVLAEIGPSDLYLSTWAANKDGLKKAFEFLRNGRIRNIKFMIDTGAKNYRDKDFGILLDRFGDCIRTTRIHAKFVVIRNEKWNVIIRTSANLNKNMRLENFEIDENKEFADFFQKFFDTAFSEIAIDDNHKLGSSQKLRTVLDKAGGQQTGFDDFDNLRLDI